MANVSQTFATRQAEARLKMIVLTLFLSILAGCTTSGSWHRPGATESQFNTDRYKCQVESAKAFPAQMAQSDIVSGYQTHSTTNCHAYGNNASCTTIPSTYIPPARVSFDANASNRSALFDSCMQANGYAWKTGNEVVRERTSKEVISHAQKRKKEGYESCVKEGEAEVFCRNNYLR